jgi:hypothetical protein
MDKAQSAAAVSESAATVPEQGAVEEQTTPSYESTLFELAKEEGLIETKAQTGEPSKEEIPNPAEPAEEQPSEEAAEEEKPVKASGEIEDSEEEEEAEAEVETEKPAAEEKLVPLREVLDERAKKRRANERAERAEAEIAAREGRIAELERALAQNAGPRPTSDNPLVDVQDHITLDRLERVYEAMEEVDPETVNDDGLVAIPVSIDQSGKLVYQNLEPAQVKLAQKRAERLLRKDIPNRRTYLAQRMQNDAAALEIYPELDKDQETKQMAQYLAHQVISGQAQVNPELLVWIGHAIRGYKEWSSKQGSNGKPVPEASDIKKIVESAKTRIAPTAPRTRTTVERKSGADLAKAEQNFLKHKDDEKAQLDYIAALRTQKGQAQRIEPVAG